MRDGWSRQSWAKQQQRSHWPFLTGQQVELFKEVFDIFDTDGKGFFTAEELMEVMTAMGGTPTPAEVEGVLYEMDANSDRVVDFAEFLSKFYECMREDQILAVFNQLAIQQQDTDSNNKVLTIAVLERCFAYVGDPLSDTDKRYLEIMFQGADKDGSGTLDINEFISYLEKLEDDMSIAEVLEKSQSRQLDGDKSLNGKALPASRSASKSLSTLVTKTADSPSDKIKAAGVQLSSGTISTSGSMTDAQVAAGHMLMVTPSLEQPQAAPGGAQATEEFKRSTTAGSHGPALSRLASMTRAHPGAADLPALHQAAGTSATTAPRVSAMPSRAALRSND